MIPLSSSLTVSDLAIADDAPVARIWAQDADPETQTAVSEVLIGLAAQNIRPSITVTGDIVTIVTTLSQSLQTMLPSQYAPSLKIMLDYTTRFLCDYMLETRTTTMRVHFGAGDAA